MASIFIFRRDYRLDDNIGLIEAMKNNEKVIPIFIFTPEQIKTNVYKSNNCVQFLCESLEDLRSQISSRGGKLYIFQGKYDYIIQTILKNNEIENVYFNMDYTKYSHERDKKIEEICKKNKVECKILEDITLFPIGSIRTSNNKIYTKFTPYYNSTMRREVPKPTPNKYKNFGTLKNHPKIYTGSLKNFHDNKVNEKLVERGGRQNGLKKLKKIGNWGDYDDKRNCISYTTTHLSAFNKFGCISIREVYHHVKSKIGKESDIIRQLTWRDFFYNLSNYNTNIYKESLSPKFRNVKWENDGNKFEKWKKGETGFPIVDACMKEINTTGYMHNRGRLIAGNFLVRLLFIDWRKGEKYFAQTLYDYDPTQNNFGWEINASVSGTESRPPSQNILNPWLQSKRFDPKGDYIKKWLPELKDVKSSDLHQWDKKRENYDLKYPKPMIDYKTERKKAVKFY